MTFKELYKENGPVRYGEDKFGQHYIDLYEIIFEQFQHEPIDIFEVGYCNGGSARLWLDYFTMATIRIIDIDPSALLRYRDHSSTMWASSGLRLNTSRVALEIMNSNDLTPGYFEGREPTIAIDDGSHRIEDQVAFVKLMYPIIKPGGFLIIEDVSNIEANKHVFEELGMPFNVADFRPDHSNDFDSVLVIYQKKYET